MPKRSYHSADVVNRKLDDLRFEISSGLSDEEVARRTGLSARSVQRWRLREGIKQVGGTQKVKKQLGDIYAVSTFGEALGDVKQRCDTSAVEGAWEPPAFVTRQHLDYALFLRVLDAGSRLLGLTEAELAQALGISATGIEQGLALNARRRTGRRCITCNDHLFDTTSLFCSDICRRLNAHPTPAST